MGVEEMSFCRMGEYNKQMRILIEECYYKIYGIMPHVSVGINIAKQLPKEIHFLAKHLGWDDTEVGDKVVNFIRDEFDG